jgi:4a-hydroxytetrahydrobiopterin dehydratase
MALLKKLEIQHALVDLHEWKFEENEIRKKFEFPNFVRAMEFVNTVAGLAEQANHHPDIDIRWNKVTLSLSTHSEGGITDKDIALAEKIDTAVK